MKDAVSQFRDAIQAAGITPPEDIIADGKLHRFSSNGKRQDDAGWYVLHTDGIPAGSFGDWRTGVSETWRADIGRELTATERAAHRIKLNAICRQREAEEAERRAEVARLAKAIWTVATTAKADHPYLQRKRVSPVPTLREIEAGEVAEILGYVPKSRGESMSGRLLVVPIKIGIALSTLELIDEAGRKSALTGGAKRGGHWAAQRLRESDSGELTILIGEGVATALSAREGSGHPVVATLSSGNLELVARAMRERYPKASLVLLADLGNGQEKAAHAALAVSGMVALPEFGTERLENVTDFNDLHQLRGLEAVRRAIEAAESVNDTPDETSQVSSSTAAIDADEATLARLSALPPLEYDRVRKDEASRLGVLVRTLDTQVENRRGRAEASDREGLVEDLEPWPAEVNGGVLLDKIKTLLERYVILPTGAAKALALWVLGTYAFDAFGIWPKLNISSPEKRCGKTTLMGGVLAALVHRALTTSNISPAAIYRVIEACRPTLLIDEADSFFKGNDELRGVINSGHTKSGAFVVRTVGENHEPKKFSTWSPMAIAGIKNPPETIVDRSLTISLRRRLPGESVAKLPLTLTEECETLRRRCKRWANDHMVELRSADPSLPESANDRMLDNWLPLFCIAQVAGDDWPQLAEKAFSVLGLEIDDDSVGPLILADIQETFQNRGKDRLHSGDLVEMLVSLEERPWAEWKHGKPMTANSLARLLRPYGIRSKQIRFGSMNRHGYECEQFQDAFDRYLATEPPIQNATTLQTSNDGAPRGFQNATREDSVAFQSPRKPSNDVGCSVVAFQNEGCDEESASETDYEVL